MTTSMTGAVPSTASTLTASVVHSMMRRGQVESPRAGEDLLFFLFPLSAFRLFLLPFFLPHPPNLVPQIFQSSLDVGRRSSSVLQSEPVPKVRQDECFPISKLPCQFILLSWPSRSFDDVSAQSGPDLPLQHGEAGCSGVLISIAPNHGHHHHRCRQKVKMPCRQPSPFQSCVVL